MKKLFHVALICLAALSLSSCIAGKFMSGFALRPEPHGVADIERTRHKADSLMPGSTAWYDGLKAQGILKDTARSCMPAMCLPQGPRRLKEQPS